MVSPANASVALTSALRRALLRFMAWWGGELAALLPVRVRRWWRGADRVVLLRLDETQAVFERDVGGRLTEVLTVDFESGDPVAQRIRLERELPRLIGQDFRLLLCLPSGKVLRRSLSLPLAVEENLRQTLSFELDRFTPFKPEQVYFDHRVVDRDPDQRRLTVELVVVRQAVLDQEMARATALGMRVSGVTLAGDMVGDMVGDMAESRDRFNFLPAVAGVGGASGRLWIRAGLGLASCLLLAAFLAIPAWQKRTAAIGLLAPLAQAKAAAMETDQLRDRLDKLVAEHNLLPDRKWGSPSALLVLDELGKRLTDLTFVTMFEFDGKAVQIQGESGAASDLVEVLEASPMFKDVAFKAQLTKIQGSSSDRFHITATLESDAWPKPIPAEPASDAPATPVTQAGTEGMDAVPPIKATEKR